MLLPCFSSLTAFTRRRCEQPDGSYQIHLVKSQNPTYIPSDLEAWPIYYEATLETLVNYLDAHAAVIEAIREIRKKQSTGPRTAQGKAKAAQNATTHGLSRLHVNPVAPGCFLKIEDENQLRILLDGYVATYHPQHPDELDLLTESKAKANSAKPSLWLMASLNQCERPITYVASVPRNNCP